MFVEREKMFWLKPIFSLCCVIALGVGLITNAIFMLVSPRAWYRLPWWFRASGGLTEEKYGSGWGAIQVRLLGAIFLVVIVWVLYDGMSRHH
jgi:hypothetical protein